MEVKRLFDILPYRKEYFPRTSVVVASKLGGTWHSYSIDDYISATENISLGLLQLGLKPGERVAIISAGRPEWNISDMAIMQTGGITVPVYTTICEDAFRYILTHSGARFVLIEDQKIWRRIHHIIPDIPTIENVFSFVPVDGCSSFSDLQEMGKSFANKHLLSARKEAVKPEDVACLMYTSGTTGSPKGVLQTHQGILLNIMGVKDTPSPNCQVAFSFLPISHAYEKLMVYLYQYLGMSIYYAQSLATIVDNMKEIHPNIMTAVPRVLEKMYGKFYTSGQNLTGYKKSLYYWAFHLAEHYQIEHNSCWYRLQLKIADKLIYSKWRAAVGAERFEIIVSGGSALKSSVSALLSAIHMPVFEGYGLTETSPVITVHSSVFHGRKVGTVGLPINGVEVTIAPDGEVLCRGKNVMKGYYQDEALTRQYIDPEGWFHTGDLGKLIEYGHLVITGRKKSLFKTSFGKYINPEILEMKCMESPMIEQMVVLGENQKFAAAVIQPDFDYLSSWCKNQQLSFASSQEMVSDKRIIQLFRDEIARFNQTFGETEKIKKLTLVSDIWSVENGILTPTLKVKRKVVAEKYKSQIADLFV